MNHLNIETKVSLELSVTEFVPARKARNGHWVKGDTVHLTFRLAATFGNVVVSPLGNAIDVLTFTRPVHSPDAWSVRDGQAWAFQTWVGNFGPDAVAMVRDAFKARDVYALVAFAVHGDRP